MQLKVMFKFKTGKTRLKLSKSCFQKLSAIGCHVYISLYCPIHDIIDILKSFPRIPYIVYFRKFRTLSTIFFRLCIMNNSPYQSL